MVFAAAALVAIVAASTILVAPAFGGGSGQEDLRMRIEMRTEGGLAYFPGLARPSVIDVGALPETDAATLRDLVAAALAASPAPPPAAGAADYRTTFLTIDDGVTRRELRISDLDNEPARRRLLAALQDLKRGLASR